MLVKKTVSLNISKYFSTTNINASVTAVTAQDDKKNIYYKQRANKQVEDDDSRPANWDNAKPYADIPGPKTFPLIGCAWMFYVGKYKGLDFATIHQKFYEDFGKITAFKKLPGRNDMVLIYSVEDVEHMLRNEGIWPIRDALHSIKYYRTITRKDVFQDTPGLTAMHGEEWFKFRTLVNPILMQPRTTHQYVGAMDLVATDFLKRIKTFQKENPQGEMPIDFENEVNKWALESIMYLALDKRLGCLDEVPSQEVQTIIDAVTNVFKLMFHLDVKPSLWKLYATSEWKEFVKNMNIVTYTLMKHIDMAQDNIKNRAANEGTNKEFDKSIFEKFLELDKKVAITMATDMLTAGIDTTSKTLGAALYFLSKNKRAQTKLREELFNLMPNKDTPITNEILTNAHYLKATIKETTRIAPIAIGNLRTMVKDTVFCGYQIPKGVDVLAGNFAMSQLDEHFPKSKEFKPERFLRSTTDEFSHKNTHPFVFLPFGFGPRSCIGKRLANLEMEITVAKIIRNFHLDWPHEDMKFGMNLIYGIADPLRIQMTPVQE